MKKVFQALGLTDKATEEEVLAAIEALQKGVSTDESLEATLKEAAGKFVGGKNNAADKKVYLTRDASVFDELNIGLCKEHAQRTASGVWMATSNAKGEVVLTKV